VSRPENGVRRQAPHSGEPPRFRIDGPVLRSADRCGPVLRALPEWFGIEEANVAYLEAIGKLPTFLAILECEVVGFLTLRIHFPEAAEIHVAGVLPAHHRRGLGRALLEAAESHLRAEGVAYLQVKTLSATHPDEGYGRTRAFYRAMGFVPLEEFPTLWSEANPCLLLVKRL
jgi:ribosomal protein S18 acetylase RimI-like enzyme